MRRLALFNPVRLADAGYGIPRLALGVARAADSSPRSRSLPDYWTHSILPQRKHGYARPSRTRRGVFLQPEQPLAGGDHADLDRLREDGERERRRELRDVVDRQVVPERGERAHRAAEQLRARLRRCVSARTANQLRANGGHDF